jgi:hypothetical protein
MTHLERAALNALTLCSMPPGARHKRFIRDLAALPDDTELTPRRRWYLWHLTWRYRWQVPRAYSEIANEYGAAVVAAVVNWPRGPR